MRRYRRGEESLEAINWSRHSSDVIKLVVEMILKNIEKPTNTGDLENSPMKRICIRI